MRRVNERDPIASNWTLDVVDIAHLIREIEKSERVVRACVCV